MEAGASRHRSDGRWREHNTERRDAILQAAIDLIEETPAGAEIPLQSIADRAGVRRSVVYRHFADRGELDSKVRQRVVEELLDRMLPTLDLEGNLDEAILRIVETYVSSAAEHPRLHTWVNQGPGDWDGPDRELVAGTKAAIAQRISTIFTFAAGMLGQQDPAIEPGAYGVVALVDGMVGRWLATTPPGLDAARLARLLATSVWYIIDGHARARGIVLDPHRPLGELVRDFMAQGADGEL